MNVSLLEGSSLYLFIIKSRYSLYILGVLEIELPSKNSFRAIRSVSWMSSHLNQPKQNKITSVKKKGNLFFPTIFLLRNYFLAKQTKNFRFIKRGQEGETYWSGLEWYRVRSRVRRIDSVWSSGHVVRYPSQTWIVSWVGTDLTIFRLSEV